MCVYQGGCAGGLQGLPQDRTRPRKNFRSFSINFSVSLILAWAGVAEACPKIFSGRKTISPAKGSAFRSPNKQFLAWSVAVLEKEPELVRGQAFLRNEPADRQEIIFETQIKAGKVLSSHPDYTDANYNVFCIVD